MDSSVHQKALYRMCRVCGELLKDRFIYKVIEYKEDLENLFGGGLFEEGTIFPKNFCNKCYSIIKNWKNGVQVNTATYKWKAHSEKCDVCSHFQLKSKGGRSKKVKRMGRPRSLSNTTLEDVMSLDPNQIIPANIEKCMTHLVSIKMKQSTLPNSTIQLKTKRPQVKFDCH